MLVNKDNIPEWLIGSEQYLLFFDESIENNESNKYNENIEIDEINLRKSDDFPLDFDDFISLYKTVSFWGTSIPKSLKDYYLINEKRVIEYFKEYDNVDSFINILLNYSNKYELSYDRNYDDYYNIYSILFKNDISASISFEMPLNLRILGEYESSGGYRVCETHSIVKNLYIFIDGIINNRESSFQISVDDRDYIDIDYEDNELSISNELFDVKINLNGFNKQSFIKLFKDLLNDIIGIIRINYLNVINLKSKMNISQIKSMGKEVIKNFRNQF